jgi:hypothetical protein
MYQHSNIWESNVPMNISNILELGKTHQRNMLETLHLVTMVSFFFLKRSTDSLLDVQKGTNRCFIGRSSKIHPQCENRDCNRGWSVEIPQPAPLKDPKTRFETTISLCFISTKSSLALLLLHFFRVILCSLNGEILSVSGAIFEGQYLHVW